MMPYPCCSWPLSESSTWNQFGLSGRKDSGVGGVFMRVSINYYIYSFGWKVNEAQCVKGSAHEVFYCAALRGAVHRSGAFGRGGLRRDGLRRQRRRPDGGHSGHTEG